MFASIVIVSLSCSRTSVLLAAVGKSRAATRRRRKERQKNENGWPRECAWQRHPNAESRDGVELARSNRSSGGGWDNEKRRVEWDLGTEKINSESGQQKKINKKTTNSLPFRCCVVLVLNRSDEFVIVFFFLWRTVEGVANEWKRSGQRRNLTEAVKRRVEREFRFSFPVFGKGRRAKKVKDMEQKR